MRVGVVGAGISGLMVVHALADSGVDVAAFEAREEPGGIVRSRRTDGRVVELGPQRLRLTPPIESLVEELGLRESLRVGDDDLPLYIYHDGKLSVVPLSFGQFRSTDLLGPLGKLRMLAEPLTAPARDGETVDDYLVRRFGTQAARRYLGPLYSGLYGTDPREMLVEYSLGRALDRAGVGRSLVVWLARRLLANRETPPICSFDEGLGTLTTALYHAHTEDIALDTPVTAIERDGEGYQLVTAAGSTRVDEVVVTTPAPTAAALLSGVESDLAATLDRFTYNPIAMVFLDSGFEGTGVGALVEGDSDLPISGTTWNASLLGRDRLFTAYVDPNSDPGMADRSDEELGALAADAFETLTGSPATSLGVHRWNPGMPAYDRSWTALSALDPPAGLHFCSNFVGRPGIPGRIRNAKRLAADITERA